MADDTEELTIGETRIRREKGADVTLTMFYFRYNVEYFNGSLPQLNVHWADEIQFEGHSVHALFVPEEQTPAQKGFIVISSKLKELDPIPVFVLATRDRSPEARRFHLRSPAGIRRRIQACPGQGPVASLVFPR